MSEYEELLKIAKSTSAQLTGNLELLKGNIPGHSGFFQQSSIEDLEDSETTISQNMNVAGVAGRAGIFNSAQNGNNFWVSSDNVGDVGTITITGYGPSPGGFLISETVTLDGTNRVAGVIQFANIISARLGSGGPANLGTILVAGDGLAVPLSVWLGIPPGHRFGSNSIIQVPSDSSLFLNTVVCTCNLKSQAPDNVTVRMKVIPPEGSTEISRVKYLSDGATAVFLFAGRPSFTPNTVIVFTAQRNSAGLSPVSLHFQTFGTLVKL